MRLYFILLLIAFIPSHAQALTYQDLWSTPDQQGQYLMTQGQLKQAVRTFNRKDWSATAAYKSGDYKLAAQLFGALKTQQGYYNQGNALAQLQQYQQAIEAYDKAIRLDPQNQDARYNRKLIKDLLDKQKKEQENKQQDKNQQGNDQQSNNQQSNEQQGKDQQGNHKQSNDQQDQNQKANTKNNKQQDKGKKDQNNGQESSKQLSETEYEQQQLLRLIPDDPGGLLREKFLRDHLRRQQGWP